MYSLNKRISESTFYVQLKKAYTVSSYAAKAASEADTIIFAKAFG